MLATERIKEILYEYETAGLIEKDPVKVLAHLADTVIGVGMGDQGCVRSKEEVQEILLANQKEETDAKYEIEYQNISIQFPAENLANLCAIVLVNKTTEGQISHMRFWQSLTLVFQKDDWYICAMHASTSELSEEGIGAYPLVFMDRSIAQLRSQFQNEAFELVNQSLSGGVLGIYFGEQGRYPLYFVNENVTNLLGYSRDEFYEKFAEDASPLIFCEDKAKVLQITQSKAKYGKDYEMRFRLLEKNGNSVWVIEHAHHTKDSEGRAVLLVVITDISDIVKMQEVLEEKTVQLEEQAEELLSQNEELLTQQQVLEEQTRALTLSEERFRIALEKSSNVIFDLDLVSGKIMRPGVEGKFDLLTSLAQGKEELILGGVIVDSDWNGFCNAVRAIRSGSHQTDCVVKVRQANGKEFWNKIVMTGIEDLAGKAVRAIGLIEDITKQKEAEIAYIREEQYRQAILGDVMASYVINFTKDEFESCQVHDHRCAQTKPGEPYDAYITQLALSRVDLQQQHAFLHTFSKTRVLKAFVQGKSELSLDYHVLSFNGSDMWMQNTLRLFVDIASGEQKGYLYVNDIDAKKRAELALIRRSEQDTLTGIYNKGAAQFYIQEKLASTNGAQTGVFMMLDIDYFKNINDHYGHPFGDQILVKAAKVLYSKFRDTDIVGRIGGDEFCVFFCGIRGKKRVADAAREICEGIHSIFVSEQEQESISCSIGVSMCEGRCKSFDQMYKEADIALYKVKQSGRNGYAFYGDETCEKGLAWTQKAEWIPDKEDTQTHSTAL